MSKIPPGHPYKVFTDKFFTSPKLLDYMVAQVIYLTGTGSVRSNRIEGCPLKDMGVTRKEGRGSYDFRLDRKAGTIAICCNDNSVVNMLSNCYGVQPLNQAKRWLSAGKNNITINQPHLVAQYNKYMGGTDRMDQNIARTQINIRIRKWWWALFCFTIDASVQNA
jgi:hypothetical protein